MRLRKLTERHKEVLQFIEDSRELDEELFDVHFTNESINVDYLSDFMPLRSNHYDDWERIYLRGNCYFFAKQLVQAFNDAKLWFTEGFGHAVVEIENCFFDARGVLTTSEIDGDFFPSNLLAESLAECWSYDYEDGSAGNVLYESSIKQIINQPVQYFIDDDVDDWDLEFLLQEAENLIYRYFNEYDEEYNVAYDNGWLNNNY